MMCFAGLPQLHRADIISLTSIFVASSSLAISYLSFKRDRGRLDASIGLWHEINLSSGGKSGKSTILITIVNSGRRPIVVDSIGGYPRWHRIRKVLHKILPKYFSVVGFFVADPRVTAQITKDGSYRVLSEGDKITISLELPKTLNNKGTTPWSECHLFYAGDTTGREHFVPSRKLNKFKNDFKEHYSSSA